MKKSLFILIFFISIASVFPQTVPVFLLKSVNNQLSIEKIELAENETKAFIKGENSENISIILPVSNGISGDFSKAGDKSVMIARFKDGKLIISVQKPDGTQKELVSKTPDELKNYDIKVNVTGFKTKKVFNISNYDIITEDNNSPVIDMFQGKIPLGEGDYSITTEITEHQDSFNLKGEFETEYYAGYYFTKIKLNNDKTANVIIDLGAAQSFLTKDVIPEGTEIHSIFAKEVSSDGTRLVDMPINGFGGKIENLTSCEIDSAEIGSIKLSRFTFNVIDSFKNVKGKKIDGIIGLDILSNAGNISLGIPKENSPTIVNLGNNEFAVKDSYIIPFAFSHGHIFIKGKAANTDIQFILDTGSPFNFLPIQIAESEKIQLEKSIDVYGADRIRISTHKGRLNNLDLGGNLFKDSEFHFTESVIFENYGLTENGGIIGTDLLKNFRRLAIDFRAKKLYLEK
ncbi:MAG TPA: pepsin/retropepsin-like aspartic protease family protein [Ignavibacteria bacterium]|nr:pepsin/retropepsin-like aspartic protease family protein [Ignavibacteria bacterium]HMQ98388.1 pepsin/retropepsin-like aspartic protease family protein [Ignavibacteria bacterium]